MALSLPLSAPNLADLIEIETASWQLVHQQEVSGLGTGEFLAADLGAPYWEADVSSRPYTHREARALQARFAALTGSLSAFYLYNPLACYPAADRRGFLVDGSTVLVDSVDANRRDLSLKGLPAGYVLTAGDLLAITYLSTRRALHLVVTGGTADGTGDLQVEVAPSVRTGVAADDAVSLSKPAAKVKLLPGTLAVEQASVTRSRIRFRARQTLAGD